MRNEELLLLIGKLNYAWTNTESLLIYLMAFLMRSGKDVAIVTFLTLNTSRARLEFIERLLRLESADPEIRARLTPIVARMKMGARVRNKYNHCIYSFDENGDIEATQLLRIADYGDTLKYGKIEALDDVEISRIDEVISEIIAINRSIFDFIREKNIRY
ncbi:MAG: hypothetical protein DCC69_04600 [Hyphomicrobiales bacterium]|nr:MAG: hypothetical protein DCC69_04600 [Hyphomicrobiales bacterium]